MTARTCATCGGRVRAIPGRYVHDPRDGGTTVARQRDNNHRAVLGTYTPRTLTVGSLFSGIGGIDLGLERAGMTVRWQCEASDFCRDVLAKHWPDVPCYPDVTTVDWSTVEPVDLLCGGFPCQDISSAGLRAGITGHRSSLWAEFARAIRELRPRYVLVENVGDLAVRGLDVVLGNLCELGLDAEWSTLSACAVGAPHPRRRLFIVAHATGDDGADQVPHHPLSDRQQADWKGQPGRGGGTGARGLRWLPEPTVDRVADGVPAGVVRPELSALGNSAVPQVVEWIGRRIMEVERVRLTCPTCAGKGYVLGIDKRYPQDGNVALGCPTCGFRGTIEADEPAPAARQPRRLIAPIPQPVQWGSPAPFERRPFDQERARRRGCETAAGLDLIGEL